MPDTLMGTLMERNPHIRPHPVYTSQEQELHDLLKPRTGDGGYNHGAEWSKVKDPLDALGSPDLPAVAKPPMFRADTPVIGSREFQSAVEKILHIAPEMRGRAPVIRQGPDASVMTMFDRDIPTATHDSTYGYDGHQNILGTTDNATKAVTVNPSLESGQPTYYRDATAEPIIAHELGHVAGYHHGPKIELMERLANEIFFPKQFSRDPSRPQ